MASRSGGSTGGTVEGRRDPYPDAGGLRVSRVPDGIAVSEAFASYLEEFRERHPLDVELACKHGCYHTLMTRRRTSGGNGGIA